MTSSKNAAFADTIPCLGNAFDVFRYLSSNEHKQYLSIFILNLIIYLIKPNLNSIHFSLVKLTDPSINNTVLRGITELILFGIRKIWSRKQDSGKGTISNSNTFCQRKKSKKNGKDIVEKTEEQSKLICSYIKTKLKKGQILTAADECVIPDNKTSSL